MGDQQAELDGVQKKYRIVEGNAKAYSGESQSILAKQRGTIEKLKGDNQQLKEELSLQRKHAKLYDNCLLYTSPSPRDKRQSRMPSSA